MKMTQEDVRKIIDKVLSDKKIPYEKDLHNGLYEVYDGKNVAYINKEAYEKYMQLRSKQ